MSPSDMNLNIRSGTVRYNSKILVSDGKFSLRKNDKVNTSAPSNKTTIVHIPKKSSHIAPGVHVPNSVHTSVSVHEEERVALVLALARALGVW